MQHTELYQRLSEEIHRIKLIDCHCHIIPFNDLAGKMDVFKLFALYSAYALLSSGMSVKDHELLEQSHGDLEKKWEVFYPYWERIKNTACAKIFLRAMNDLFGYRTFETETYNDFSKTISQVYAAENTQWYREVLKEKAGIALGVIDYGTADVNREFFVP
ncbi:MAG: hypothetical protein JXB23_18940, partial [Candidatus Aminicenantes bacterium]|nr:hypothetical protein [Candidatus Aminicenantes bacterium]